jgi:hypothetical protein
MRREGVEAASREELASAKVMKGRRQIRGRGWVWRHLRERVGLGWGGYICLGFEGNGLAGPIRALSRAKYHTMLKFFRYIGCI